MKTIYRWPRGRSVGAVSSASRPVRPDASAFCGRLRCRFRKRSLTTKIALWEEPPQHPPTRTHHRPPPPHRPESISRKVKLAMSQPIDHPARTSLGSHSSSPASGRFHPPRFRLQIRRAIAILARDPPARPPTRNGSDSPLSNAQYSRRVRGSRDSLLILRNQIGRWRYNSQMRPPSQRVLRSEAIRNESHRPRRRL